jgi:hypothetical protein
MGRTSRDEIDRLKYDANLVDYACSRAGYQVDLRESSPRGNPTNWILRRQSDDSKILALRGPRCWLYFDLRDHGEELGGGGVSAGHHGTVIDFIQHELGLPKGPGTNSFALALKELREFVGSPLLSPHRPPLTSQIQTSARVPAPEVERRWEAAHTVTASPYLAGRGLLPATLGHERFRGTWRVDGRGNVLFAHRDARGALVGFEIKNSGFTSYPRGGVRTGMWRSHDLAGDRYYLLTESAINAMSFHQLHPELAVTYRSFGGRIGSAQLRALEVEFKRLPTSTLVLLAFDGAGDRTGQHYEQQARSVLPRGLSAETAHPPHTKDWNDYLQAIEPCR